ncbi:hypothetical protein B0A49_06736 [Cryomyces minteri]|uniref:Uncharacterized protein n=1 Tax=Cryomyces minteri TaxID=331657 RepID=A0A4U0XCJ9_9PEZI|nr:hypothetical protein B0A49_06736 [Cryomyces minteri]
MQHPYQCICVCHPVGGDGSGMLLAASGPKISSVNLQNGSIVSSWPDEESSPAHETRETSTPEGPPGKKRKIAQSTETKPNVIQLTTSHDHKHVIAATGEDKCIRVFAIDPTGQLTQLSERYNESLLYRGLELTMPRCMPKRPCAIAVTPDNQTVILGDKHGDVYSLPLLPEDKDPSQLVPERAEAAPRKAFVPAATNLTVHTGRNLKALEAQQKQKDLHAKTKEPPKFESTLLLGHVSMLTDLLLATVVPDEPNAKPRNYILTSDRDEHIRVSRGLPQTHVIEGYCLGHTEFVSKLCIVNDRLLVSGGGNDWLGVWDWVRGELEMKLDLKDLLVAVRQDGLIPRTSDASLRDASDTVAVSGLWACHMAHPHESQLLIALEGVPALFHVPISQLVAQYQCRPDLEYTALPGNLLDIAIHTPVSATSAEHLSSLNEVSLIVSVDNMHALGSTSQPRSEPTSQRLLSLPLCKDPEVKRWGIDERSTALLEAANSAEGPERGGKGVAALCYGVETLRKRGGGKEEEEEG